MNVETQSYGGSERRLVGSPKHMGIGIGERSHHFEQPLSVVDEGKSAAIPTFPPLLIRA